MLKIFGKSILLQAATIAAATLLLWWRPLANPTVIATGSHDGILFQLIASWLEPVPLVGVVLAIVLVLGGGITLNLMLARTNLTSQTSLLPTLLYTIMMSAPATTLNPAMFVGLALVACVGQLTLHGTLLTIPTQKICNATALIGIASLFYVPAIAFVASYLLTVISYRLYGWRDWTALLLGLLAPYISLVLVLLMTNDLPQWWQQTTESFSLFGTGGGRKEPLQVIATATLALIVVASIMHLWSKLGEKIVVWQKNATVIMLLFVGGLATIICSQTYPIQFALFAVPFALCGTHLFSASPSAHGTRPKAIRTWVPDLLFILTIASALLC